MGEGASDYEEACSIDDYCGIMKWRGRDVLVLNDEPHQTAVWRDDRTILLVRWMAAPDEENVVARLQTAQYSMVPPIQSVNMRIESPSCLLFDAAVDRRYDGDALVLDILPGHYTVTTCVDNPCQDLGLIIHSFELVGGEVKREAR